jgi:hypothetical protein
MSAHSAAKCAKLSWSVPNIVADLSALIITISVAYVRFCHKRTRGTYSQFFGRPIAFTIPTGVWFDIQAPNAELLCPISINRPSRTLY